MSYTYGYGLTGDVATHARLEKITLPGGRQIYYNYEDANAFAAWHGHLGHESRGRPGPALRRESAATGGPPVEPAFAEASAGRLMGETPMPRLRAGVEDHRQRGQVDGHRIRQRGQAGVPG